MEDIKINKYNKKINIRNKKYIYFYRNITKANFINLTKIFGVKEACEILNKFEGCYLYIPKKEKVKKELKKALIRFEYDYLLKNKVFTKKIELKKYLSEKYNLSFSRISVILFPKNKNIKNYFKEFVKSKDDILLKIIKENKEILQQYNLL